MKEKDHIREKVRCKMFFLILLGTLFVNFHLTAQTQQKITVTGVVIDEATKEPIIGASVLIKGTTGGTMTDLDGGFNLQVPQGTTLVVSFLGFRTQEIKVTSPTTLSISMEEDVERLDEVVVIGYGQVRKGDATGSLASLKPDGLNKGLQVTAQDALVGKIAGVNVVPGSGAPGSEATIRIRMGASLSASNDPLVVIDGVPISGSAGLSSINPNDIETFNVLKDASATAIYGSRASNGVIIITTKKGVSGSSKPKINYSANFSVRHIYKYYDVLSGDEYRKFFAEKVTNADGFQLGTASTDWQKQIYQTAFGNEHNLTVTGNTYKVPYRVSVGYTNQNGILKSNNYERYNAGIGLSPKFLDNHLSFDINIKGSIERDKPVSTSVISGAIAFDPTRPVYANNADNVGLGYYLWMNGGKPIPQAPSNPLSDLKLADKLDVVKRSIGNIAVDYKIHGFEDLRLNVNMGYDIRKRDYEETIPDKAPSMYSSNQTDGRGKFYSEDNKNTNYLFTSYANYTKDIAAKHNINAMAGYEWQRFWYSTDPKSVVEGVEDTSVSDKDVLYLLSFFGRLNYSFDQKLMLTTTLRADASSRFSKDNRWGYFPSAALAYRLSEEGFLKNIKELSDLKLRLSYGQTGQQDIGGYHPYLPIYTISSDAAQYQFGDDWVYMYRPDGYDPNIKWETTDTYNLGLDFGFLNNRIYGSLDLYKRYTKDLLNYIDVPAGSNFTNKINTNIGDMDSKGIEVAISAVPVKTRDLEWTISGNFTYSTATIKKLNIIDSEEKMVEVGTISRKAFQRHKVGETPYTFFLLKQAYDDDGKPLDGKYIAPDGSITTSVEDANKYMTGKSSMTPYHYGLSTRLTFKQWDFGINGHGSFGNYVFNYQEMKQHTKSLYESNISSNISRSGAERAFTDERTFSDYFLESGAFFKLDNITLGYTINRLWNTPSSLRLAFSAQNVAIFTNYSGVDPELYSGLDNNVYQRPRIYTLSLNLNF